MKTYNSQEEVFYDLYCILYKFNRKLKRINKKFNTHKHEKHYQNHLVCMG